MSNYDKIKLIKEKVEKLKNVDFYSLAEGNSLIIKNKATSALYEIKYLENDTLYSFDTNDATLVSPKEKTNKQTFTEHATKLHKTIKGLFVEENFDKTVQRLKQLIQTLPNVNYSEEPVMYQKSNKQFKRKLGNSFAEKLEEMEKVKAEYNKSYVIFDEENDIIKNIYHVDKIEKLYNEAQQNYKTFVENIKKFAELKTALTEKFNEEMANEIFGSVLKQELKVAVPKAAVKIKSSINEEFNILDSSKEIINIVKRIFEEQEPSVTNATVFNLAKSAQDAPKFLKFHMDLFTLEDLRQLVSELTLALSAIGSITPEDMAFINERKMQAEYMLRTGMINDKLVQDIIDSFNDRFQHDASDMMNDNTRGFTDTEQMSDNNVIGKADIEVSI